MTRLRKKGKGFTLIELVGVLVIMAIIVLIVIPLVMNIIRKAKLTADKRSIDAYGRSIELAIASYLLDTGNFPTEVSQLTIEYSGDTVSCTTEQINPDSSVFLAGCTVKNRAVEGYEYGKDKQPKTYSVGEQVTYNGVDYYVIKNSGANEQTVTLLKVTPLTVDEVNRYGGVGTENNHVNMYANGDTSASDYQTAYDINGYGGMAYYTSETCGYTYEDSPAVETGCKKDYASSDIKYVVDAWVIDKVPKGLEEARLIKIDEIETISKEVTGCGGHCIETKDFAKYEWMYNSNYKYWTMTLSSDSSYNVNSVDFDGSFDARPILYSDSVVRPVIVLDKSVL